MHSDAMRTSLLVLLLLNTASCGLAPSNVSCDVRPAEQACVDLLTNKNSQLEPTLRALCVGTYSNTLCDHTGALGGCRCDTCENGQSITWMFPDASKSINTVDDVKKACGNRVFVAP